MPMQRSSSIEIETQECWWSYRNHFVNKAYTGASSHLAGCCLRMVNVHI